jgi:hypothetical protein
MIEVWEKLDCESVGAAEIEAIEAVVREQFGDQAVDPPMKLARALADEGAILRHSEIMGLYLACASERPYDAAFRNILDLSSLGSAVTSIRSLESLRQKYKAEGDREGLRLVREAGLSAKQQAEETAARRNIEQMSQAVAREVAEWFRVWLQTPDMFASWIDLRMDSPGFKKQFEITSG